MAASLPLHHPQPGMAADPGRMGVAGRYVPGLDGLRGIAVLAVVVSHTWPQALTGGWCGVDIFFVLSGYLITSLLLDERARTGRISLPQFYLRRALRLFPALAMTLILAVAIAVLVYPGSAADTLREAVAAIFYVANWFLASNGSHSALLDHTWSLSIEEQFYWTWPLLLMGLAYFGRRSLMVASLMGLIGLVLLHRLLGVPFVYLRTDTRADSLLVGCLLAVAVAGGALQNVPRRAVQAGATAACLGLALAMVFLDQDSKFVDGVGFTLIAVAAAGVIFSVAVLPLPGLSRAVSSKWLVWVGKRSYGVYLYHPLCLALLATILDSRSGPVVMAGTLALTLMVARTSYKYLERPFLRLKDRARFGARVEPPVRLIEEPAPA